MDNQHFEIFQRWVESNKESELVICSVYKYIDGDCRRYVGDLNPSDFHEGIKELRTLMLKNSMNPVEVTPSLDIIIE